MYGIIIRYNIPKLMLVPKAVSSMVDPCSAINLHCEHPWLNIFWLKKTNAKSKGKNFFDMIIRVFTKL